MMNNKGLTLIEIIISIAIIAIVALLFVNIFGTTFQHIMNAGDQSRNLIEEQKELETLISTTGPGIQFDVDMHDLYPTIYPTVASEIIEGVTINEGDFTAYLPGVKNYVIFVTNISLSPTSYIFAEIGDVTNITSTVLPNNATDHDSTWTSNNESIVQVQNGLLIAKAVGTATVTAVADGSDPSGAVVKASVSITVNTGGPPVGTNSSLSSLSFEGVAVPGFDPAVLFYNVEVAGGKVITLLASDYVKSDPLATVLITQATATDAKGVTSSPFGANTIATIRVVAEDGITVTEYTLHFLKK